MNSHRTRSLQKGLWYLQAGLQSFLKQGSGGDKCKQCLLCAPVCPDSSIPVVNGMRGDFDYDHCKGCGICVKACPFGAIEMKEGIV